MDSRMRRLAATVAVLAGALAIPLAVATPAVADEAECEGSFLAKGGYSLFQLDDRYVPPPLRGTGWDCASRITDRPFDDGSDRYTIEYSLLWMGIDADEAIGILQRFVDEGWIDDSLTIVAVNADGRSENQRMAVSSLREWDPPPATIITRFSDIRTLNDIIQFEYQDGSNDAIDPALAGAVLRVDVSARAPWASTGPSDPSVLSSLRTIAEAVPSATQLAVLGGSAVFLMLVVGFPGYLLNKVLGKHWAGMLDWLHARRAKRVTKTPKGGAPATPPTASAAAPAKRRAPSWLVWPGFVIAAIIAGFVDPAFGFNPMSVRLIVTSLISFVLLNVVGWIVVIAVLRRMQPDAHPTITFRFGSLVVVALTVLVARLLQFEPGVIFGLVAGLTFAITLAASRDAFVILLGSGVALVLALGAWIGYSAFGPLADAVPGSVLFRGLAELFSGVVVEGVSTLPLALLPLLALDGAVLFAWRKWVWAIAYAVGAGAFVLVMFTIPEAWGEVGGGFGRWLLLFMALGLIAVGVWVIDGVVERRAKRNAAETAAVTPAGPPPAG